MSKYYKYILLAIAVAMIVAGIISDEVILVLRKASHICLECIGVG